MTAGKLHPRLPWTHGLSVTAFVSCHAPLNGVASARKLCTDLGLGFQSIVDGDAAEIAAFARLVDASPDALLAGAIQRRDDGFVLRGERLLKSFLRREHFHVCPDCLKEDISNTRLPPRAAIRGRVAWLLSPIRTCPIHDRALVEVATSAGARDMTHDFAALVGPVASRLDQISGEGQRRAPSRLERYLLDRLEGASGAFPWLDALEFHVAAKTCEMIGAVRVHGRTPNLKTLSEDEWQEAGGAGFDLCAEGEAGVRDFLSGLQRTYPNTRSASEGPQAMFGRVYQWLAFGAQDRSYDPVRDVVRQHIIETMPVGTGDEIFGVPVERRVVHSIRSASLSYGLHPKQLRKILVASGIVDADQTSLADNRITFDADRAEAVLVRTAESMTRKQAGDYMNSGRVQTELLERHGFIVPIVQAKKAAGMKDSLFARSDLDAFLAALGRNAKTVERAGDGMADIPAAARRANRSAADVIRLILDGSLARKERLAGVAGYMSIHVDVDEVRSHVAGATLDGLTAHMIEKDLQLTNAAVKFLLESGRLPRRTVIHPVHRCPVQIVAREDFEEFKKDHVALSKLAKERRVGYARLRAELDAMGVAPALDGGGYGVTFYRRADVAR